MNVQSLKQYIIDDSSMIELILEEIGMFHIKPIKDKINCGWTYEGTGTSVQISTETLRYFDFSNGTGGDLITLVSEAKHIGFKRAVQLISKILNIEDIEFKRQEKIKLPFGGFYKNLTSSSSNESYKNIKTYDESILDNYAMGVSKMFCEDGISALIQEKYCVGYDVISGRIIVPWRNIDGEIIGIMGRYNSKELPDGMAKWLPVIEFPKTFALFGYSENYIDIQKKDTCFIFESEKAPMQMSSMGIHHTIANGGSIINEAKALYIKGLGIKRLILAYDEGVTEEFIINQANKLKANTPFYSNKVGYIYDDDNSFLPKDSKMSPSDLDLQSVKTLIKQKVKWL